MSSSSSASITVPVEIPSAAALSRFRRNHNFHSSACVIAVGYSLVLHRFLDARSHVYVRTRVANREKHETALGDDPRQRCTIDFQPDSTLLNALQAVNLSRSVCCDDDPKEEGGEEAHLALLHQDGNVHGSKGSSLQYAFGLVFSSGSKTDGGTEGTSCGAVLDVNAAVYSEFQAHNVARALSRALQMIADSTTNTLSTCMAEVDIFSSQDHAMINGWNLDRYSPSQTCLPDLFERACAKYPHHLAILSSHDGTSMTYERLNRLATRLATHLVKTHGLGRGAVVPLCFDKSSLAVVAMVAVLKTGAAYCCLDAQHPRARHDFIMQSVNASLVLVTSRHQSLFRSHPVLVVDDALVQHLDEAKEDADKIDFERKAPDDTCIVVFSSGSTGVPKGVVHTHQTLATGLVHNGPRNGLDHPSIRVFQWCAYTFDISITEIWGTLICGGVVCIPSEDERLNDVESPMKAMAVEWAFFTPSFARFFCRQRYCVETLKTLVVGGEALTQQDAQAFLEGLQGLERVVHLFGPAELITQFLKTLTRQDSRTLRLAEKERSENMTFEPANAHCWVVDPDDVSLLVPVGAVGELVIEGPALFTGYLNDTARTQAALISPPEWRSSMDVCLPTSTMYRSGDLVRYVDGGELRYVSRKDGVVKLRGQFVDLGEIESLLRASLSRVDAAVPELAGLETEAAVLLVTGVPAPDDQALVVFVCTEDTKLSSQDRMLLLATAAPILQTRLRKNLPEYMVPRLFRLIDEFPYNASGKLDRKNLALLAATLTADDLFQATADQVSEGTAEHVLAIQDSFVPEQDEEAHRKVSKLLKIAWCDVFGPDFDQDREDFFQRGGNSMRAMELVAAARRHGVSITIAKIFGNPAFVRLVSVASIRQAQPETTETLPFSLLGSPERTDDILRQALAQCRGLDICDVQDILPATPMQAEFMAAGLKHNGSFKAQSWFAIPANVSLDQLKTAWGQLSAAFATMRCRMVRTSAHENFQVLVSPQRPLEWIELQPSGQTESDDALMDQYLASDRAAPMGYGEALARFAIIGTPRGSQTMVLTMHQSIYDGFTVKNIEHAINKLLNGKTAADIATPSYAPFIKYVSTQIDQQATKSFWQDYLSSYGANEKPQQPFPALPGPNYAPKADSLYATNIQIPPKGDTAAGRPTGTHQHITLATIVLAAWALIIHQCTGDRDIVFPLHISGRGLPVPGIMDMMFPTIASVPVRIRLPPALLVLCGAGAPAATTPLPDEQQRAAVRDFLQAVQADQIQMATAGFGHVGGMATISGYSEACRMAVDICERYPQGCMDIQYATATWQPKPGDGPDAASVEQPEEKCKLEFQVNREHAKYFVPSSALTLGCYLIDGGMARLVFTYDSKVVQERQIKEYSTWAEGLIRNISTSI